MDFCSIASGSSGNCIFAGTDQTTGILIDAGISGKRIVEQGLNEHRPVAGKELNGILVTHEHSDHIKGLGCFGKKAPRSDLCHSRNYPTEIKNSSGLGKIDEELVSRTIRADEAFSDRRSGRWRPFAISHDAAEPVAYRIWTDGEKDRWAWLTDLGVLRRSRPLLTLKGSGRRCCWKPTTMYNMLQVGGHTPTI